LQANAKHGTICSTFIAMRTHSSTLASRMRRAAQRVQLRFKVVAVGLDYRGRVISLATNSPRLEHRSWHAEERIIHGSPRSLAKVLIARVGRTGNWLPIDPCAVCVELARKRGVEIERLEVA
jgi:hypothetical protein